MKTKRIFSILLVAVMLFAAMPMSAFAAEKVPYTDIDYSSTVTIGEIVSYVIEETDPYINVNSYGGYANGFTVELEAGKEYIFSIAGTNYLDQYIDINFSLMPETLSGNALDILEFEYNYGYFGRTDFTTQFSVKTTGRYKILLWGYVSDNQSNELLGEENNKISFIIDEKENFPTDDILIDIESKDDLFSAKNTIYDIKNALCKIILNINKNIDLENEKWSSISLFRKLVVNGNHHVIKGLTSPLFGEVSNIEVFNLGLEIEFYHNDSKTDFIFKTPLFCTAASALISNCHASGSITSTAYRFESISGLFGDIYENGTIENCSSTVDITLTSDLEANYIGGLSSYIDGYVNVVTLKNCHYNGNIIINNNGTRENQNIGGLIGECSNVRFENCSAEGTILSERGNICNVGGFIGTSYLMMDALNCYANVNIDLAEGKDIGGFIGDINGYNLFKNCYAIGDVCGTSKVGGFCGYAILGSVAETENIFANCYANGNVKGDSYVGGFCGYLEDGDLQQCYSSGNVTSDSKRTSNLGSFAGFCGQHVLLELCYANQSELKLTNYSTEPSVKNLSAVDFSNDNAVKSAVDAFNSAVEDAVDPELLSWIHADGKTPSFELPTVESPKKPCGHIGDGVFDDFDEESHWEYCTNLDCVNNNEAFNAEKHSFEFVSDSADCENGGTLVEKCSDCEQIRMTDSPKKGHIDENGDNICDVCDYVEEVPEDKPEDKPNDEPGDKPNDEPGDKPNDEPNDEPETLRGDVNNDGKVDADDYILLKRVYFGQAKLSDLTLGDINKDGKVNADDYILLKRVYFGQAKL